MGKSKANDPEIVAQVLQMYKEDAPQTLIASKVHIGRELVRKILIDNGVYSEERRLMLLARAQEKARIKREEEELCEGGSRYPGAKLKDMRHNEMLKSAITRADIEEARRNTPIGSKVYIRTLKGTEPETSGRTGVVRRAIVENTDDKVLCHVKIECSGLKESIPWTDIVNLRRRQAAKRKEAQR